MGKDAGEIRQEIAATRERMGDTVDAIAYKADVPSRVQDAVSEKVNSVKDTVSNTATRVTSAITGSVGSVRDRVGNAMPDQGDIQGAGSRAYGFVRENPLGVFLALAAVGFLLASLLPATDMEQDRLGPVADRLKETAKTTVNAAMEEGRAVIQETISSVQTSATSSLNEHAQNVAQAAQESFKG